MAPQVNLFAPFEASMRFIGMFRPESGVPHNLSTFLQLLSVLGSLLFQFSMYREIFLGLGDYYTKLEMVTIALLATTLMYKQLLIVWKQKEVLLHIETMNSLLEKIEGIYGEETLSSWQSQCRKIMHVYVAVIGSCFPVFSMAYYRHYVKGVPNAIPYEAYTPFDTATQFNYAVIFQAITFYSPGLTIVVSNTLIGSMSVAVAGVLDKINDQFSEITSSANAEAQLKNTIFWHTDTIKIVDDFNSLFGSAILVDYLLAMMYLCNCTFLVVKAGNDDQTKYFKYVVLMIDCLALSLSCYWFGNRVSLAVSFPRFDRK